MANFIEMGCRGNSLLWDNNFNDSKLSSLVSEYGAEVDVGDSYEDKIPPVDVVAQLGIDRLLSNVKNPGIGSDETVVSGVASEQTTQLDAEFGDQEASEISDSEEYEEKVGRYKSKSPCIAFFKSRHNVSFFDIFRNLKDVAPDHYKIIDANNGYIGASHVTENIAVCVKGVTSEGRVKLGIYNVSDKIDGRKALETIHQAMVKKGCKQHAIETYLVGGQFPHPTMSKCFPGTQKAEMDLLAHKDQYGILEHKLPCNQPNETSHVAMNKYHVFCTTEQLW